ncbi:hypothetical protein JRQ81_003837 [Phrynocephalus forsythii]|uniref:Phosphatidylinositol 5-phosphate 4-kinase type-2 gamma n=1 Tax=Phrynocephalus forsythii TaxID=171643 RepID=A0A9Q0XLM0_9SAUR|nr:hypothetical protein JRQ81_003837 [Phrynocephalus forsythii]
MAASAGPGTRTKTKKKHFVPQRVKVLRSADPLLGVLGWGINHQISELSQVPQPVMLLPDDFKANSKIKVNNHLFNRESLPGHFKFKEYCPQVFRNLRERFNIDDQDYLYIVKCHGSTLLPQFLGMYRLSVDNEESYMLVMRNMFSHRLTVHRKYDLKGSLVSREASDKEKGKELPTLKDIDFLNMNQKVYISEEAKRDFMEKLKRDVEFLVQLKIMGYSLLLGIHDVQRAEQEDEEEVEEEEGDGEPTASVGSYGTSPEGIGSYLNSHKPLGPGDFDPYVDVYAIKSAESKLDQE